MKKFTISLVMALTLISLIVVPVFAAGPSQIHGKSIKGSVYLYEKTEVVEGPWAVVAGGAWGKFNYTFSGGMISGVFNGKKLDAGKEYTLVAYTGWPNVIMLGTAKANKGGNVNIKVVNPINISTAIQQWQYEYAAPVLPGAKIWLVPTSLLTNSTINAWGADVIASMLFEGNLVR